MNVVVLGGAGRVGSLLARQLAAQASELVRIDQVASDGVVALLRGVLRDVVRNAMSHRSIGAVCDR